MTTETGGGWIGYCPTGRWDRARHRLRRLRMFPLRLVGRHPDQIPETRWEMRREDGAWVIRPADDWPFVDRTAPPAYSTREIALEDRDAATWWARSVLPRGATRITHDLQDGGPPERAPD